MADGTDQAAPTPLAGLRVLELGSSAAVAVAGFTLACGGAETITMRPASSPPATGWDAGKQTVTVDLESDEFRARLRALLPDVDVVIHALSSDAGRRIGLDAASVRERWPQLVVTEISTWGSVPPTPEQDRDEGLITARTGINWRQPGPSDGPSWVFHAMPSIGAGLLAVHGSLAALLERLRTGRGCHVQTSRLAGALAMSASNLTQAERLAALGDVFERGMDGPAPFYSMYRCADGRWLQVACGSQAFIHRAIEVLGIEPAMATLRRDPGFGNGHTIPSATVRAAVFAAVRDAVALRTAEEWVVALDRADVPAAMVQPSRALGRDPQIAWNRRAAAASTAVPRGWRAAPPLRFDRSEAAGPTSASASAPALAATSTPLPASAPADDGSAATTGRRADRPLSGVTVLEIGNFIAGPLAARYLADLGAEVIKLESVDGGDLARRNGNADFFPLNAGKRGVSVDLKSDEGRRIGMDLAERADILIQNMRPGAAERLGLGYQQVTARNPGIGYCHVTAFGTGGPYAQKPGMDPLATALSGAEVRQGRYAGRPIYVENATADHTAALLACAGALMSLWSSRSGRGGWFVATNLLDASAMTNADDQPSRRATAPAGRVRPRQTGPDALHAIYRTADGWISIAAGAEHLPALLDVIRARPGVPASGKHAQSRLRQVLAGAFSRRSTSDWLAALTGSGVSAVEVAVRYETWFNRDPMLLADDLVAEFDHPAAGLIRFLHRWLTIDGTAHGCRSGPPLLGEDTAAVLGGLGYGASHVERLASDGVILLGPRG